MFSRMRLIAGLTGIVVLCGGCVSLDELDAAGARLAEWNAQQDGWQEQGGWQETDYVQACYEQGGCGTGSGHAVNHPPRTSGCPYAFPDGSYGEAGGTACPQ